jgi:hypothetical protein
MQGVQREFVPSLYVVALGLVFFRAHVLIHWVARAEEHAERRHTHSADHAGLEVEELRAGHALAALGLVVEHVYTAELPAVVAAEVAIVADAVLFEPLPKL